MTSSIRLYRKRGTTMVKQIFIVNYNFEVAESKRY